MKKIGRPVIAGVFLMASFTASVAQDPSSPGPTNPNPPSSDTKFGAPKESQTIVINPTTEQCREGWNVGLQWSKEKFDEFCGVMTRSK